MNYEELHTMILQGAVAILAKGEEASPILFCVNEKEERGDIIPLGEVFHDKDVAADFIKLAAKLTQATMVGMVNEGWTSKAVGEGKVPFPEKGGLKSMPDAVEILVITIESKDFSRMWTYPIQLNDANQRVLDIEEVMKVEDTKGGMVIYNRFSVFGRDDEKVRDLSSMPNEGEKPS